MRGDGAFTLLEVLVSVTILAVGVTAVERRVARSVATLGADADRSRAMLLARSRLAEAELAVPEVGHSAGARPGGVAFEREVLPTPHPGLREVRVQVRDARGGACELVEVVRVPAP